MTVLDIAPFRLYYEIALNRVPRPVLTGGPSGWGGALIGGEG